MSDTGQAGRGLALVGVRGTGKSTVGRLLAARLGWSFADADAELERRAGRTIRDLFAQDGEGAFRDLEERVLVALTAVPRSVLATGGGAVLRPANRRRLRAFGFVVWLRASPEVLAGRLVVDSAALESRPALTAAGTLAEIGAVLAARTPLYAEVADAVVDTDGRSPEEVAASIGALWRPPPESEPS